MIQLDPFAIQSIRIQILFILLLMSLCTARAEWTFLLEASDGAAYVDLSTLKKNGDFAKVWFLREMKAPTPSPLDKSKVYRSSKVQMEADCKSSQVRVLYSVWHEGSKSTGKIVSEMDNLKSGKLSWQPIPTDGSFILPLLAFACN